MASTPYSRNTFEAFAKLRHYVGVRLKQGVPLVDADLNEMDDLRRYELRNFLRWFVGNGVPNLNDGFRILPSGVANDVLISGGNGTPEGAGRCLVDGLEVLNESTVAFSAQEFANAARAAAAGVPVVTLPSTPAGPRTDIYYLDVMEREITSAETGHGDIVDPRIGIEAARRIRREWAVRVVDSTTGVPADDTPPGHRYLPLASVARVAGVSIIPASAITDLRRKDVTLISRGNIDQVTLDAFGPGYTLSLGGQPSLAMSLREVINAILKDGRPAVIGPRTFQTASGPHNFPASALDAAQQQWVFWIGPGPSVFYQQLVGGVWSPPAVAFPASGNLWNGMSAVGTADGSIWVVYSARIAGNFTIVARRWQAGTWTAEMTVSTTPTPNDQPAVAATSAADIMIVWRHGSEVWSRQYIAGAPQAPVQVSANVPPLPAAIALTADGAGGLTLYALESVGAPDWPIRSKRWQGGIWDAAYSPQITTIPVSAFVDFVAIADRFGGTWFIWATQLAIGTSTLRARRVLGTDITGVLNWVSDSPRSPTVARDANANLQAFYRSGAELQQITLIYEV
jgi:hypothetical protein